MKIKRLLESEVIDPGAEEYIEEQADDEEEELIVDLEDILNIDTVIENPSMVSEALDRSLKVALRAYNRGKIAGKSANVLFVGRAGTGKTAKVVDWAKARGVNLLQVDAKTLDPTDIGGLISRAVDDKGTQLNKATKLSNPQFNELSQPGSVLFVDELNRASSEVMGSLLTLILDHVLEDVNWTAKDAKKYGGKAGMRPLPGFLFTVACINPTSDTYEGVNNLDMAMRGRFRIMNMGDIPETKPFYDYVMRKLDSDLKTAEEKYKEKPTKFRKEEILEFPGKKALAKKLLTSPLWQWDTADDESHQFEKGDQYQTLSPRDFSAVIAACDGTKEDLIKIWPDYCNDEKLDMIEEILADYEDIDDKANSVFAKELEKEIESGDGDKGIFGKASMWDSLEGLI